MNKDCVSLETAQRLQKAGWKGECEREWANAPDGIGWILLPYSLGMTASHTGGKITERIPAPTAVQIAEELPAYISIKGTDEQRQLCIYKTTQYSSKVQWFIAYRIDKDYSEFFLASTLPDALGLMMEYLLVNGLLK